MKKQINITNKPKANGRTEDLSRQPAKGAAQPVKNVTPADSTPPKPKDK